jgi:nucleotide-binding universal stress UspA family protein
MVNKKEHCTFSILEIGGSMKIQKILLPFDGSLHSINAAKYALKMANVFSAHVTIINCYETARNIYYSEVPESLVMEFQSNAKKGAEEILIEAEAIFAKQGVEYKLETISGSPGYVLANLAKSEKYDLIVMGSHGHSDIAGLFLGHVTHKVLNTIYCPVLIVP